MRRGVSNHNIKKGRSFDHLPESLETDRAFTVILLVPELTRQNTGMPGHEGADSCFAVLWCAHVRFVVLSLLGMYGI